MHYKVHMVVRLRKQSLEMPGVPAELPELTGDVFCRGAEVCEGCDGNV